jgi:hypothetical protein
MNRKQRRNIKANAPAIAAELAGLAYDYTPAGNLVRVSHPVAVAALKRAFAHMLSDGGQPHTMNRPGFTGGQNSRRIAPYGTDTKEEDLEAVFA